MEKKEKLYQGGYIKADLLDVAYIRSNIIDTQYIQGLELNFVKGTIGGITISENSIHSENGLFKVSSDGHLEAKSGYVGGFKLLNTYMSSEPNQDGGRFALNPAGGYIAFIGDTTGSFAGIGNNVMPATFFGTAMARFENQENTTGANIALHLSAKNGASANVALSIDSGDIKVKGLTGITVEHDVRVGGQDFYKMKWVNGILVSSVKQ